MYSAKQVIECSCDYYGITTKQFYGSGKKANIVIARFAAWYILYEHSSYSYPQIATHCKRDHTSIMNGVRKARRNSAIIGDTQKIIEKLGSKPRLFFVKVYRSGEKYTKLQPERFLDFRNDNLDLPKWA